MKPKKCKLCRNQFKPIRPLQSVCSHECSVRLAKVNVTKEKDSLRRKNRNELKRQLMTHSDYMKLLQVEVNTIVRMIDFGQNCISSDRPYKPNDQAGHYFSVGSNSSIRFNLWNIHSQSVSDNMYKSGNNLKFTEGLQNRYGIEIFEKINQLPSRYELIKLSIIEIQEAIQKAKQFKNTLTKTKKTISELIELRELGNKTIGIYE